MHLSINQIVKKFRNETKGTTAVTIHLDSPQDKTMRKTGNPYHGKGIVKRTIMNGIVGYIYENAINRIAVKEGKEEREAKPHPWGDMDSQHLFRINRKTGEHHLSMMVRSASVVGFFFPDGKKLTEEQEAELKTFLPEKKESSTQEDLDQKVTARDSKMENITMITYRGQDIYVTLGPDIEPETEGEGEAVTA